MIKKFKELKTALSQVSKGYTGCTTGGCCGISLPPDDQKELKRIKQQGQDSHKNEQSKE
ncbi:MAG: hypothetical protein LKF47_05855 [Megasphaera sp.]|jgi:hypothetical protein|nr:hypothetical protein [Megasphaera sp.]MCI1247641.1 hypothetical protein [Megasphaera sp.]